MFNNLFLLYFILFYFIYLINDISFLILIRNRLDQKKYIYI